MEASTELALSWRRLGAILVERGLVSADQLRRSFELQATDGRRLGEIMIGEGWVTSVDLALALAAQHNLPFVDLAEQEVDMELAALLPEHLAIRYRAVPVRPIDDQTVLAALADPSDLDAIDGLRLVLKRKLSLAVADQRELEFLIRRVHHGELDIEDADEPANEDVGDAQEVWHSATSIPAVRYVNNALGRCIEEGASDIHFAAEKDRMVVRARIDGVLREVMTIPKRIQSGVVSRLKIMGSLDIAERRAPQDGRMFVTAGGEPIDLRVAVLPTTNGEQVVVRILNRRAHGLDLDHLGMTPEAKATFVRAISQPHGAVIACGPTGSGKTTTLYTALDLLNHPGRALMTIEDPVEYQIDGIAQIEVRPKSGLTFARGLRTILRSDPDVLLVGEVRDEETARIAIQAAMTGHLVLTSLHAQDAASSIERLKDMGVEPGLLSSAINCVVAQRLARRLCVDCRRPYTPTARELQELEIADAAGSTLYQPVGCARCARTGYRGRVALYEIMPFGEQLRTLTRASTGEILAAALQGGMKTLRQDGRRLALEGVTSLTEVRRVTGDEAVD